MKKLIGVVCLGLLLSLFVFVAHELSASTDPNPKDKTYPSVDDQMTDSMATSDLNAIGDAGMSMRAGMPTFSSGDSLEDQQMMKLQQELTEEAEQTDEEVKTSQEIL